MAAETPKLPAQRPRKRDPKACAASSTMISAWCSAILPNASISHVRPLRWVGRMARVRVVSAASTAAGSIKWSGRHSTGTGLAPAKWIAAAVASMVCELRITSSPSPMPAAKRATSRPSVALPTPNAWRTPRKDAKHFSKSSRSLCLMKAPRRPTSENIRWKSVSCDTKSAG